MTLTLTFWGTRGSVPSPGASTAYYGGNTPCVELRTGTNALLILDAGTGIRHLGRSLLERANGRGIIADILLSHAHWDHIQGLPFFAPLYDQGHEFTIRGAPDALAGIEWALRAQMTAAVFPVTLDAFRAQLHFRALNEVERGDGFALKTIALRHPGGATGYRISDGNPGAPALVYISDNELGHAESYSSAPGWRDELVSFVREASLLVHDAMYTADEYERHRGWGHSRYEDVVDLALDAGVQRLVLYHHHPERSDTAVSEQLAACQARVRDKGARLEVLAAAEGTTLTV
ncbi:MAG TPA: MBL fold metallo-hydrolase [Gemmatimonadaceae bacterium]|nr:MBL fold metallo-hydrolase [Gemmatimonadaceae bacterium]